MCWTSLQQELVATRGISTRRKMLSVKFLLRLVERFHKLMGFFQGRRCHLSWPTMYKYSMCGSRQMDGNSGASRSVSWLAGCMSVPRWSNHRGGINPVIRPLCFPAFIFWLKLIASSVPIQSWREGLKRGGRGGVRNPYSFIHSSSTVQV